MSLTNFRFSFNSIIESIFVILQYDVMQLFLRKRNSQDNIEEIAINECRLSIYEGQPSVANLNEVAKSLGSSISEIECVAIANNLEDMEESENVYFDDPPTHSNHENISDEEANYDFNTKSRKKSKDFQKKLDAIEGQAQYLWNAMREEIKNSGNFTSEWQNLKSHEKLLFYWSALSSNEQLSESPFENFQRFYMKEVPSTEENPKKINEANLIVWHSLTSKQKLPFIMEAFIARISHGKVDIANEVEIKGAFRNLQNKGT
ncbi:uncharacterized protein LOC142219405 [Haematobia irritans]|uniref:uncharacterized protein LOC142219405 n=1 Tax=Haematobia irritans TaxID=7368 RepID=UPI003F4FBF30